jgi:hypothetical protein
VAGSAIFDHPDGLAVGMERLRLAINQEGTS